MIIKYKTNKNHGNRTTPCPVGMRHGENTIMVASYACVDCGLHISHDRDTRTIECAAGESEDAPRTGEPGSEVILSDGKTYLVAEPESTLDGCWGCALLADDAGHICQRHVHEIPFTCCTPQNIIFKLKESE